MSLQAVIDTTIKEAYFLKPYIVPLSGLSGSYFQKMSIDGNWKQKMLSNTANGILYWHKSFTMTFGGPSQNS